MRGRKKKGRGEENRGRGKKKMRREGKRIFSNVLGKIFIKHLPQHLKKLSKMEEKEGEGKKNN